MLVKDITESFVEYKKPSMVISTCYCDWKCCKDACVSESMCQNSIISKQRNIEILDDDIIKRFKDSYICQAVVFAGLEPMLQIEEICMLIKRFNELDITDIDFVIYTGYYPDEIVTELDELKKFKNIIVKFGRYIPNSKSRFDEVLGVTLASDNQFAERIS